MLRCQHILETVGAGSKEGSGLFGDMRRMIVQNDSNGAAGRVVLVEILEQSDEFPAAMSPLDTSCDMTLVQIQRREDRTRPKAVCIRDRGPHRDVFREPGADRPQCWRWPEGPAFHRRRR